MAPNLIVGAISHKKFLRDSKLLLLKKPFKTLHPLPPSSKQMMLTSIDWNHVTEHWQIDKSMDLARFLIAFFAAKGAVLGSAILHYSMVEDYNASSGQTTVQMFAHAGPQKAAFSCVR